MEVRTAEDPDLNKIDLVARTACWLSQARQRESRFDHTFMISALPATAWTIFNTTLAGLDAGRALTLSRGSSRRRPPCSCWPPRSTREKIYDRLHQNWPL